MKVRYRYVSYGAGRNEADQLHELHRLMHQLMARATPGFSGTWQPPMDVYETDDALYIHVELAGVREEDIDITLFADHLTISGTRQNRNAQGAAYYVAGILYGNFRLEIPVATRVDRERVAASFEDGLLTITLPKAVERIQPSAVSIQPSAVGDQTAVES